MHTTHKTAEKNGVRFKKHTQAPHVTIQKKNNISYSQYEVLQNPKTSFVVLTTIRKSSCHITSSAALPPGFVPWSLKQRSMLQPHMQTRPVTLMFSTHLFWCEHLHQVNLILLLFIFRIKDEVNGEWRSLHNQELHNLYSSPNIIRISNQEEWDGRYM